MTPSYAPEPPTSYAPDQSVFVPRLFCEVANWVNFFSNFPNLACSILSWRERGVGERRNFSVGHVGNGWRGSSACFSQLEWKWRAVQMSCICGHILGVGKLVKVSGCENWMYVVFVIFTLICVPIVQGSIILFLFMYVFFVLKLYFYFEG